MKQAWLIAMVIMTVALQAGWFSPEKKLVVRHAPPMDVSYEKREAMSLLNEIREAMGMNTLVHNDQLAQAAQAHADYLVKNRVTSHGEIPGRPGFTGRTPAERALHAGYLSTQVSENLSTKNRDARSSIDGLFSAIYHRFGFLDVGIDEIGVGAAQDVHHTENSAFVYVMGNSYLNALCHERAFKGYGRYVYGVCRDKRHRIAQKRFLEAQDANRRYNPKIVCYPYDGQKDVPPSFYDEMPDPLPDYEVSGFPVSVTFNAYFFKRVELVSFTLTRSDGKPVGPLRLLSAKNDPNGRFTPYQFALFPLHRLEYDTEYQAKIIYKEQGRKMSRSWYFHTRKFSEPILRITKQEATITIRPHKSYLLYLVPRNGHDVVKSATFPEDLYVEFLDNNTLRIKLMSENGRSFDIKSKKRVIHVNVK